MANITLTHDDDTWPGFFDINLGSDTVRGIEGNDRIDGGLGNDGVAEWCYESIAERLEGSFTFL